MKDEAPAEWLRRVAGSYYESERLYDTKLIHDVIAESQFYKPDFEGKNDKETIVEMLKRIADSFKRFREELNLPVIPSDPVPEQEINKVIELPEGIIPGYSRPRTFEEQVNRLLFPQWIKDGTWKPDNDVLERFEHSLINYTIRRMIIGGFPSNYGWLEDPPGLFRLSAALITLHLISKMCNLKLPWEEILRKDNPAETVSECEIVNLRPDGPLALTWQKQLARLRRYINVLRNPVIGPLCSILSKDNKPRRLVSKDIAKILKTYERKAWITKNHLELILTERFLPAVSALGLRYRYIISSREGQIDATPKVFRREFGSPGLVTRMLGFELYRDDKDRVHRLPVDIYIHVEPIYSKLPEYLKNKNLINLGIDTESISFRLDLFNPNKSVPWSANLSSRRTFPQNEPLWLRRDLSLKKPISLTLRQAELLGVLWSHKGSFSSRQRLIDLLGYPRRTVRYALEILLEKEALSVMYHPALELSGLPELLMFVVQDAPPKIINNITRWFLGTLPYVHIKISKSGRDLIAYLRMPLNMWDSANQVRDKLQSEVDIRMIFIKRSRSYYMTLPNRLFDRENQVWRDPWLN